MSSPSPTGLRVHELTKSYGAVEAVRGVSFEVRPGEIFGLLGQNGAGKTSAIECILGLRRPDTGSIRVDGIDTLAQPARTKPLIGALLQSAALQDKLTPRQAVRLFASFYATSIPAPELLGQFGLTAKADATFDSLSGGQKQRLFLALAFLSRPRLLILDEPTAGLDPQSRRELHSLITSLKAEGRSVLLCTHHLDEAQRLCDRIGILHEGRLIATATPAELIAQARAQPRISFRSTRPLAESDVAALPEVLSQEKTEAGWLLVTANVNRTISGLVQRLEADGSEMLDLQIHQPSLEDVFLELTGRSWAEPQREDQA